MLHWDALHPYNAIHLVRLPRTIVAARLQAVIATTLEQLGLTGLELDRCAGTYEYRGGPAQVELATIAAGEAALAAEIKRQLNRPFVPGAEFSPFRFFVASEADSFWLGLVYFHAVADAEAIVRLLQVIVAGYLAASPAVVPLECHPAPPANLLLRHPGILARKLLALPAMMRDLKQSFRPPCRAPGDLTNEFTRFTLEPVAWGRLRAAAKAWGVTANDLLLALLLKSFSAIVPQRSPAARRHKLSVGCIVNTRPDAGGDRARTFGLALGSFVITHAVPAAISLRDLAADLHRRTQRIKQQRLYLAASMEITLARAVLAWFSPERRKTIYPKNYPLCGGITNLNLNSLWPDAGGVLGLDYIRAVSTGPVTPLVLSVTTVGTTANLGISYRPASFTAEQIAEWKMNFLAAAERLDSRA